MLYNLCLEPKQIPARPCPKKPKTNKVNAEKLREKNKLLAELLEQPSKIIPQKTITTKEDKCNEDEDNDQPLNLCVRDAKQQNNCWLIHNNLFLFTQYAQQLKKQQL